VWLYHSHVDESADTNAGLLGAVVVNRAGANRRRGPFGNAGKDDLLPSDIDDDVILFFSVIDEFTSRYATDNVKR
jgi:hephaestin